VLEFNLAALFLHRLTILVAGISFAYVSFRLFLAGDPRLKAAAWTFAVAGVIALAAGCAWKPPTFDPTKSVTSTPVSAVPDSIMDIVRSLCRAQLPKEERRRFLAWYAAEHRACP